MSPEAFASMQHEFKKKKRKGHYSLWRNWVTGHRPGRLLASEPRGAMCPLVPPKNNYIVIST